MIDCIVEEEMSAGEVMRQSVAAIFRHPIDLFAMRTIQCEAHAHKKMDTSKSIE